MPQSRHSSKYLLRKRQMKFHPDEVRSKIQAQRLVTILQSFIFGDVDKNGDKIAVLSMAQVRSIDVLLKKCVPDLTRTLISADLNVRYVAELPKVLTKSEWINKYGTPDPKLIEGTVNDQADGTAQNGKAEGLH